MPSTSSSVRTLSSFNLLFFTQVLTVLTTTTTTANTTTIQRNEYITDKGKNISIPCIADGSIMWVKENAHNSTILQTGKYLVLFNVTLADSGLYVCFATVPPTKTIETEIKTNTTKAPTLSTVIDSSVSENALNKTPKADVSSLYHLESDASATTTSTILLTTSPLPSVAADSSDKNVISKTITPTFTATTLTIATFKQAATQVTTTHNVHDDYEEPEYQAVQEINLIVRTPPGPVTQLYFKASTILGFLIWRFNKSQSGGYPVRSFTAEYRNITYSEQPYNKSYEHEWVRMDPINISPNVRQMEVYHLAPNTTYEFRMWANNLLGSGDVVTTNVTTLPETKEEDLIRLIKPDLDNFDPRIWIIAVSIVLGTLVILAVGLCIVLTKECYQSSQIELEDGWDSIELIPNIIFNPGFSDSDAPNDGSPQFTRTIIFDDDDDDDDYDEEEEDHEPTMKKFKRKVSVFFTGPSIKRI